MNNKIPSVVTIGGGTGTYVVLSGLRDYPINISAIVTMMDSGGSTGRLRDQLGVLPPGDLRQALIALSDSPEIWRKLFTYRFQNGDLNGHNFGNIFLSALEKITGSIEESVDRASDILQTRGQVIPVTFTDSCLCAEYIDGTVIEGEAHIEDIAYDKSPISHIYLSPNVSLNLVAKRVLERADFIILGPGDLYTSILPNLLVDGMYELMKYIPAKKIYVSNLMTRVGQTDNYKVSTFYSELSKYLGEGLLDYILINSTKPKKELLDVYKETDNAVMVEDDIVGDSYKGATVIRADLLSPIAYKQTCNDAVKRSLIRHSSDKVGEVLFDIFNAKYSY